MSETTGLGLLTTDRDLVVRSWNTWLAEATGLDEGAAQGRSLLDRLPAERRDLYRELFAEVLQSGVSRVLAPAFHHYLIACPPRTPSSHFDHMQQRVTVAPLQADAGIAGLMVTIEDVTERLDGYRSQTTRLEEQPSASEALPAVGAGDWRLRGTAVKVLRQAASREEIAHLLDSLQREHQDLNLLSSALQVLIAAGRDVVPPLVALLADPNPNLRMHAALALGQLQDPAAQPALIAALDDPDANVRFHAIEAIGRAPGPEAVEPLSRIASSGDFFLAFPAVDALARADDARVGPSLLSLLSNDLLRPAVVDALAALGDEECVAPLIGLLNSGEGEVGPVAAALVQIGRRYEETYGAGDYIIALARGALTADGLQRLAAATRARETPLGALITLLGWTESAADDVVSLVGTPDVSVETTDAVLRLGRHAVVPLIAVARGGERAARIAAVGLLGRIGDPEAVAVLTDLLTAADADLVGAAAAALATIGDPRALEHLGTLFAHEHPSVRQAAIAAVNSLGAGGTGTFIRKQMADADPRVRECAIRVAGYFGFDECAPQLLDALAAPEEEVRRAAIEQLPVISTTWALDRLVSALLTETARNRAAAAHAARTEDEPSLDGPLLEALRDEDAWVRYFAAKSLGQRRRSTERATDAIAAVALNDRAPQVRIAAVEALGLLAPEAALPIATQLLSQPDEDLAGAALTTIAAAADARSDELIEQTVRSGSPVLRARAISALASRRTTAAVDALAWASRMGDSSDHASDAVKALGTIAAHASGEVRSAAIATLVDLGSDPARRETAAGQLARLPTDSIPEVAQALTAPWPGIRLTAVSALARMRHPHASAALAAALRDADPSVRAATVFSFGRLGSPSVASTIAALRDNDPDAGVRRRAAAVCQRHGWTR